MSLADLAQAAHRERIERMAQNAVYDPGIDLRRRIESPPPPPKLARPSPKPGLFRCSTGSVPITGHFDTRACLLPWQIEVSSHIRRKRTLREIHHAVCQFYNIRLSDLLSQRRDVKIVRPRHIAFYLARTLTKKSMMEVAKYFGGRDHSTVSHGVSVIEARRAISPDLAYEIKLLLREFGDKL